MRDLHRDKIYSRFDRVLGPDATQGQCYETACGPLVTDVLDGFNAGLFAYGQSGSGKTYTLLGPGDSYADANSPLKGVIPRAIDDFFKEAEKVRNKRKVEVSLSFYEIYKEDLYDLLKLEQSSGKTMKIINREEP